MKRLWVIIVGLAVLSACSDDPARTPPPPVAEVIVTDLFNGDPVPGIKVAAMNVANNAICGGPRVTDGNGRITFDFTPTPDTRYLVFGGLNWVIHHQADWTSLTTPVPIVLRPVRRRYGLPRIAGRVIDAVTGEPLSQVFIGISPQPIAYSGGTDPGTDLTGPDGEFLVQEIVFAVHPITGNLTQVEPLFVSRQGYRPRSWVYRHANGDDNLDITGAVIALTPIDTTDTGRLVGRLLLNGLPAEGVPVGLGGFSNDKSGFGLPEQVAHTDSDGRYAFTGLTAGFYLVHPGFGLRDGFYYPDQARPPSVEVTGGGTTEAGDLMVAWEIVPQIGDNSTIEPPGGNLVLGWSPVPGAFEYLLYIDGTSVQSSVQNRLVWEIPPEMENGWHTWRVLAVTESHNLLGAMQKDSWWQLTSE